MSKKIVFTLLLVLNAKSFAFSETVTLPSQIEAIIETPEESIKGLVVIAPAKKYLMRERLFARLAEELTRSGYATVRFNWGSETLQVPQLEITRASEDLHAAITYAQHKFGIGPDKTALVSKSFSSKALGLSISLSNQHVVLTPNCSVEMPFESIYGPILGSKAELNILISNDDPNCDVGQIYGAFESLEHPPGLFTTKGDHNFVIMDKETNYLTPNYDYQDQVIRLVAMIISAKNK